MKRLVFTSREAAPRIRSPFGHICQCPLITVPCAVAVNTPEISLIELIAASQSARTGGVLHVDAAVTLMVRFGTMTTYVLIPGAGGAPWYWHRLVPELQRRGHDAVAVSLPAGDNSAGLAEYADAVIDAIGDRSQLIVVAQPLAGFTAPLVCERLPVDLLVLLNAMVPAPGETAGDWWATTGHGAARAEQAAREGRGLEDDPDLLDAFFHDVPPEVTAEAMANGAPLQSPTPFSQPWPARAWPPVPTRFLQSHDDRFFPVEFQRRVVQDRLGITLDEMPGGHLVALSQPRELASRLEAYRDEIEEPANPPSA